MEEIKWWGYLHQNGSIIVKRWSGDHRDYTDDCDGNEFVVKVVPPFEAPTAREAMDIIQEELKK